MGVGTVVLVTVGAPELLIILSLVVPVVAVTALVDRPSAISDWELRERRSGRVELEPAT
jgi:hypothetical protein